MAFILLALICFLPSEFNQVKSPDNSPEWKFKVEKISDVNVLANALKTEILNSKSELFIVGTSYYVSNNGNDENSGKSPDEPWASLSKVSGSVFKSGDGVLFERNGLWRGSLTAKAGVSYSAYGEGEKPRIIGSPQNFSVKEKWILTNTPNVYLYDQAFNNDAGLLVFNHGEAYTYKKLIGIDGFKGSPSELKKDLEMYHDINDKKIYLYSDKGNPADRYTSIEFCLKDHIIRITGDNVKIDNLCIKYGGAHGISSGARNDLYVTNCEFGWIGGSIQGGKTRYGNAIEIYGPCKNYFVDHCYIYEVYDAAVTHQFKNATSTETKIMENVRYTNNLIENCIYSFEYFLDQPKSENDVMKNILIKDNICRLAGYGFGWQRPDKVARHIQGGWIGSKRKYPAENFIIEGNIFDRSIDVLLSISAQEEAHLPKMKDNIYIQNKGGKFGMHGVNYDHYYLFDQDVENLIKSKGIEENPTIIFSE